MLPGDLEGISRERRTPEDPGLCPYRPCARMLWAAHSKMADAFGMVIPSLLSGCPAFLRRGDRVASRRCAKDIVGAERPFVSGARHDERILASAAQRPATISHPPRDPLL